MKRDLLIAYHWFRLNYLRGRIFKRIARDCSHPSHIAATDPKFAKDCVNYHNHKDWLIDAGEYTPAFTPKVA